MKKIGGLLLIGIVLFNSYSALAQTYAESALLFSRTNPGGSARIQALGGAQVSLGGDYSSAQSNPAGLGMFNRSEFSISPGFLNSSATTGYLGNVNDDSQSKLIIPGISLAFHKKYDNGGSIFGGTFGITVNRTNNFNRSFTYSAGNSPNSIIDYFINTANSANGNEQQLFSSDGSLYNTPTELAWGQYLINPTDSGSTEYTSDVLSNPVRQREQVKTSGSQYQINFAYGANLSDKFYFGAGVGIASARFKSVKTFSEDFSGEPLASLHLTEFLDQSATGINATFGAIYKPAPFIQFGGSVATPTYYVFSDTYSNGISTNWSNFPYAGNVPQPVNTDDLLTNYSLTTPWRLSVGTAVFIQKYGFITIDLERMNYANAKYRSKTDYVDLSADNSDIRFAYRSVNNVRVGAEGRISNFRLRAGYSYMQDPYRDQYDQQYSTDSRISNSITTYSVGAGYRATNFYIDVAYLMSTQNNMRYLPYRLADNSLTASPIVKVDNSVSTFLVTVGFPFTR